jgi:hypothetical protein
MKMNRKDDEYITDEYVTNGQDSPGIKDFFRKDAALSKFRAISGREFESQKPMYNATRKMSSN